MNQRVKEKILSHFDAAVRRDLGLPPRKLILNLNWKFRNNPISFTYFPDRNMTVYVEYIEYARYLFMVHAGLQLIENYLCPVTGDRLCQFKVVSSIGSRVRDVFHHDTITDDKRYFWNPTEMEMDTFLTAGFPEPIFCNEQPLFLDSSN